jgi:hypothetical protein
MYGWGRQGISLDIFCKLKYNIGKIMCKGERRWGIRRIKYGKD